MSTNQKIISIQNLFSVYNENQEKEFVAINDVTYDFDENKIYCIIGNSGSGKSTLINHFNGLLKTKYGVIKTRVNEMGFNWNLSDIFLSEINLSNKLQTKYKHNFLLNTSRISKKMARILIEANTRCQVLKIKLYSYNNKVVASVLFIGEYESNTILSIDEFNQLAPNKITPPNFFKRQKLRKIKKFKALRKEIGVVFQFPEYQLFKDTIEKDIMFGPVALGTNKKEAKEKAKFYLNKLSLDDSYLERSPFGLSGGQKRRVAIAGILAIETNVLIFDEPTAGLDPVGEQEMMDIILDAKKTGKTVFVITHNMNHVLEIADEVIVLNDGKILKSGKPYEIFLDDDIINKTSIDTPKVIKTIKDLNLNDEILNKIIEYKPKTVKELAEIIIKLLK